MGLAAEGRTFYLGREKGGPFLGQTGSSPSEAQVENASGPRDRGILWDWGWIETPPEKE